MNQSKIGLAEIVRFQQVANVPHNMKMFLPKRLRHLKAGCDGGEDVARHSLTHSLTHLWIIIRIAEGNLFVFIKVAGTQVRGWSGGVNDTCSPSASLSPFTTV